MSSLRLFHCIVFDVRSAETTNLSVVRVFLTLKNNSNVASWILVRQAASVQF